MDKQQLYNRIISESAKIVKKYIIESEETSNYTNDIFDKIARFKEAISGHSTIALQITSDLREILVNDPNISFKDIVEKYNIEDKYPTIDIAVIKDCYDYISDEDYMYHININIEKLLFNDIIRLYEKHKMFYCTLHLQSNSAKSYPFNVYAYDLDELLFKVKLIYTLGQIKLSDSFENIINQDYEIELEDKWQSKYNKLISRIMTTPNKSDRKWLSNILNKFIEMIFREY